MRRIQRVRRPVRKDDQPASAPETFGDPVVRAAKAAAARARKRAGRSSD